MNLESRAALAALVRRALLVRLGVALVLSLLPTESFFAPDQQTYHIVGTRLAAYWSGESLVQPAIPGAKAYFYIVGALYSLLGPFPLVPKLLNAVIGALIVPLLYDLALRVSGSEAVALRAAGYTAFFPSLVLWSALNIRDCWVVFLIVLICRQAMALQEGIRPGSLAVLTAAVVAVIQFRDYIFFAISLPVLLSFVVRNRRNLARNVIVGMLLTGVVIYADRAAGSERKLRTLDLEELQEIRHWTALGGSRFAESADISTPQKALAFLPVGIAYFLLAPFPWNITNLRQAFTLPEMLFFYSLIPAILRGIGALVRQRLGSSLMLLLLSAGLTVGYALGQGNVGTAYRHRAQVLPFYLIFGAVGVELQRRGAETPAAGEA